MTESTAVAAPAAQMIRVADIHPSKTNPRKHFDEAKLAELVASVKRHGVLQPILVRQNHEGYELVAGERRWRAAKEAELEEIPASVRELSDVEVLEIQVVENLHRADLHPMEEAEGYEQLHNRHKYSVEDLAAKVGKSVAYVYARMKLCALTKDGRQAFLEDQFTAGHAILLARLKPADQKRAMDAEGAVFTMDRALFDDDRNRRKPTSVREFQSWIDKNVRFDVEKVDERFFPETAQALEEAETAEQKVVPITHEYHVDPMAKINGVRTFGPMCWRRADGKADDGEYGDKKKSKTCEHSVTGVIVVGRSRGEAFKVCVNKDKCDVHWGAEKRQREKLRNARKVGGHARPDEQWKKEEEQRKAQHEENERKRKRWDKAKSAIVAAIAKWAKDAPTDEGSVVARLVVERCEPYGSEKKKLVAESFSKATSAHEVLRKAAFLCLMGEATDWNAPFEFPKVAKERCGIDVGKILNEVAPVEKPAKKEPETKKPTKPKEPAPAKTKTPREHIAAVKKASKKAAKPKLGKMAKKPAPSTGVRAGTKCRGCGCTEEKACEGGCTWVEPDLCSACDEGAE